MDFNPESRVRQDFEEAVAPSFLARILNRLAVSSTKIRGLDMSHWQDNANINFPELKAEGIEFAILKVTEGISYVDETFQYKYLSFLENDIIPLPYHFFRGNHGGASQAMFAMDTLDDLGYLDDVPFNPIIWMDVETEDGISVERRRNRLHNALITIESNGLQGGVYSSPYYWNTLIGTVDWVGNFYQWVAHWTGADLPTLPINWSWNKTITWQNGIANYIEHPWVEPVNGYYGPVDHDYFFGDLAKLKEILQWEEEPPPVDCCDELSALIAELQAEVNYLKESDEFIKERLNSLEAGQEALFTVADNLNDRIEVWEDFEELLQDYFNNR